MILTVSAIGRLLFCKTINFQSRQLFVRDNVAVMYAISFLVSTSTGVVTDASWKCSSSGGAVEQTGWHLPGFDDAAWSQARVVALNRRLCLADCGADQLCSQVDLVSI